MTDDEEREAREVRGATRVLGVIRAQRAEEQAIYDGFARRSFGLRGEAREQEVRRYVRELVELLLARSPWLDVEDMRAKFFAHMEQHPTGQAVLAKLRTAPVEA